MRTLKSITLTPEQQKLGRKFLEELMSYMIIDDLDASINEVEDFIIQSSLTTMDNEGLLLPGAPVGAISLLMARLKLDFDYIDSQYRYGFIDKSLCEDEINECDEESWKMGYADMIKGLPLQHNPFDLTAEYHQHITYLKGWANALELTIQRKEIE